jgi:uncharacterized membrane protein YcjF (UPF0283 family)
MKNLKLFLIFAAIFFVVFGVSIVFFNTQLDFFGIKNWRGWKAEELVFVDILTEQVSFVAMFVYIWKLTDSSFSHYRRWLWYNNFFGGALLLTAFTYQFFGLVYSASMSF